MMPYREQIEQAAAEQAVDLLAYYDGPDEVRENLVSIIPSVAVQDGKLCGCTAITLSLIHISGQYARAAEIGDELESMQAAVDGLIDCAYPWREKVCIVCNDEGLINGCLLYTSRCV